MMREGGSGWEDRLSYGFRLVTSRKPSAKEVVVLRQLFQEQRDLLKGDPDAVSKALTVGEAANDPTLNPLDLAAAAVVGTALLNHDEAVMRR
jgi:hypothetical protein